MHRSTPGYKLFTISQNSSADEVPPKVRIHVLPGRAWHTPGSSGSVRVLTARFGQRGLGISIRIRFGGSAHSYGETGEGPEEARMGTRTEEGKRSGVDYRERGQWLRAGVLGANDGLISTASLMVGVGAVKRDAKSMLLSGVAALVAGACSMAIGEFVSVSTQRDVHLSDRERRKIENAQPAATSEPAELGLGPRINSNLSSASTDGIFCKDGEEAPRDVPKPLQAAVASALAFTVGAAVPLLSAAFIAEYSVRVGVLAGASSAALVSFGAAGALIGGSPAGRACLRVLVGGWIAMLLTYALLRLFAFASGA